MKIIYEDGSELVGEDYLNAESDQGKKVKEVALTPTAQISPAAKTAIEQADLIIIGPGDYHASLLATLLPIGTKEAFANSKAKTVYLTNLMSRHHQTDNMRISDYVTGIEHHLGKKLDHIIVNSQLIPQEVIKHYESHHEYPVTDDLPQDNRVIRAEIISDESIVQTTGDDLSRSFLRHDNKKLTTVLKSIIK